MKNKFQYIRLQIDKVWQLIKRRSKTDGNIKGKSITKSNSSEQKLSLCEQKFKIMTDASPLAIYMSSGVEQKADYINSTFTKLFGYTIDEVPTVKEWWPLAYPDETYRNQVSQEWQAKVEQAIRMKAEIEPMEVIVTCKDGSKKNILWGYISTGMQNWAYGQDITERKQAEEALAQEKVFVEALLESVPGYLYVYDDKRNLIRWNKKHEMMTGYSAEELSQMNMSKWFEGEDAIRVAAAVDEVMTTGYGEVEGNLLIKGGGKLLIHSNGVRLNLNGKTYFTGVGIDITERKQAEAELIKAKEKIEKSEKFLNNIINNIGDPVFVKDDQSRIILVNDSFCSLLGLSKEQMIGKTLAEEVTPEERESFLRIDKQVLADGKENINEESMTVRGGQTLTISTRKTRFLDAYGNKFIIGVIRDITERKHAELLLQQEQVLSKSIIQSIPGTFYMIGADGRFLGWNAYQRDEIVGKPNNQMTDTYAATTIHPDDREQVVEKITNVLTTGTDEAIDARVLLRGGPEFRWLLMTGRRMIINGDPVLIGIGIDTTEHKLAENEIIKLNEELEQRIAQRTLQLETTNKELEAFSYSVSHDLRAPLRALDGFAQKLAEDYSTSLNREGNRLLKVITDNAHKMGVLIDDLLSFSRLSRQEIKHAKIDMHSLANDVYCELATNSDKEKIKFQLQKIPMVYGDPAMMRQVWVNLISNSIKFSSQKKNRIIEIGNLTNNAEITYYVKDNGAGFDMAYANKLFGVFQRLHSTDDFEGTGVGLALVDRIIHRLNGRVWAEAKENEGATFYFTLPNLPK